ncbi:hypothetical protein FB107DRAFT_290283 [Schizophyllum commune]
MSHTDQRETEALDDPLDDSPFKNSARDPKAIQEENTKQARAMHVQSAEDHTRQCTLTDFWPKYVEGRGYVCLSNADLDNIIAQLDTNEHFIDSEWKLLQPDKKLRTENEHFGRLCEVIDAVVDASATCLGDRFSSEKRTTLFDSRPNQETLSEVPGSSFHVDGLHYLIKSTYSLDSQSGSAHNNTLSTKSGRKINTADVVGSAEVKLDENPVTVRDGTAARLWCHNRSHSGVTNRFDIHKNKRDLIQWFLFVSFADEAQLGFDPTTVRVLDTNNQWQYQFDVHHPDVGVRTYQTVSILHENCAAKLYSRAMRVFKVKLVVEKGKADSWSSDDTQEYALRDCWLYDDEQTHLEFEIQTQLYQALKKATRTKKQFKEVWQHFLPIVADGVVQWEDVRDSVPAPPKGATPYKYEDELNPAQRPSREAQVAGNDLRSSAGYIGATTPAAPPPTLLQLLGRKHCRTLYGYVCVDLYKIDDPALFFHALDGTVFVLSWLRRIGWMHRDISPGNVMLRCVPKSDGKPLCERYVAQLADLEYAKEYAKMSQHDPRTGTGDYMAIEAQLREHVVQGQSDVPLLAEKYFAHNFIHDLESTAWMALEFAMRHVARRELESRDWLELNPVLTEIRSLGNRIFPNLTEPLQERRHVLTRPMFRNRLSGLLRQVYGDASPILQLVDLFANLWSVYKDLELAWNAEAAEAAGHKRMPASLFAKHASIYDKFRTVFQAISNAHLDQEGQDAFVPLWRIDFDTGDIRPRTSPAPFQPQVNKETKGKRKEREDAPNPPPCTKRSRTPAPPRTKRSRSTAAAAPPVSPPPPAAPRRSRKRTKSNDSQQPLRRSSRLAERSRSRR